MINKAFLDPWVRQKMHQLLDVSRAAGLAPIVTSTWRDPETQVELFRRCQIAQTGQRGFPVKRSPCSSHEWGFSFDARATAEKPLMGRPPSRVGPLFELFCHLFPRACEGMEPEANTAQFTMGLLGNQLTLRWSPRDAIHFSAFTPGEWDPHMRNVWGLDCTTCTYPGGQPI